VTAKVQALLEEYEACRDFEETVSCIRSLDAPHYHHELTKRALLAAFEKPDQAPALLALMRRLADTGIILQVLTKFLFNPYLKLARCGPAGV
jgi:DNA-binding SARP family transcriptional activator